jgi:poly(3-hydroxybutyrate) depolymerase
MGRTDQVAVLEDEGGGGPQVDQRGRAPLTWYECVAGQGRGNRRTRVEHRNAHTEGHLRARPVKVTSAAPLGLQPLGLWATRDGYLYVSATYQTGRLTPLVVLLHGAGDDARDGLALLREQADGAGLILLALASRGPTWDLIVERGDRKSVV